MRILHLAWEYPPVMYGGLGRHVHALAHAQARAGHEVVVITQAQDLPPGAEPESADDGPVRVLRVPGGARPEGHEELLAHVAAMEGQFTWGGSRMLVDWQPEVIHAHDWMVAHSAVALRAASGAPLVATIHATEAGRRAGWVSTPLSARIHEVEGWLATTADAVITCSATMAEEVRLLFGRTDAHVVANGIDLQQWRVDPDDVARLRADLAGAGPLLAYTGRVEFEKGVQTLLAAMPELLARHAGLRLVVAGRGSHLPELQRQAASMSLDGAARFLGWVSEADLRAIVAAADVVVAPSLYEPFGLVALEAASLGTPLVVSGTGGLAEFAREGDRARTFRPGDPANLAAAIEADLADPAAATARAARARRAVLEEHDWHRLAGQTVAVYLAAEAAMGRTLPEPDPRRAAARTRHAVRPPEPADPPGRVLDPRW
ncbi:MAG: glycosyltransferase family 4 protein [Candidatus Nanopelagicales bacterium]|jgi:glycogen(starch) synthase|nr:glycosyltransferase family 4 protein [Candidatus Nanopelagicales bacterium]